MMRHLDGFAPLAQSYGGFILDLWGVIHDGVSPYPGAVDCLQRLRGLGKPAVLLSNAPRRAHAAAEAMRGMGIGPDLYTGIITSGELAHWLLRDHAWPLAGRRVYHIGPERDRGVLADTGARLAGSPAAADGVLNTGPDDTRSPSDAGEYEDELQAFRAAGLPMLCANPDLEVIRGGTRIICAGALALRYEALGGQVLWVGKPDPSVYVPVMALLGLARPDVLAVGDALRTDIAGAAAAGIEACLVLGGIHAAEFASAEAAEAAARSAGLAPVATLPAFRW